MVPLSEPHVYVYDQTGQLKYKFGIDIPSRVSCCASVADNEIMLVPIEGDAAEIYTEEGNLKLKIKLPAASPIIWGAAFDFVLRKIMVIGETEEEKSNVLHCYSETGKLETSMRIRIKNISSYIISHPSGPVVIVENSGLLLSRLIYL